MDGRKGFCSVGLKGGIVFERKEGAEAVSEWGTLRAKGVAEG